MTNSYEVYSPDATTDAAGAGTQGGSWHVAAEYSNKGDAKPPTVVQVDGTALASREAALAAAEKAAFRYERRTRSRHEGARSSATDRTRSW